jgi:hypothetical protein
MKIRDDGVHVPRQKERLKTRNRPTRVCVRIVTWFLEFPWDMEVFLMPNSKSMGILDAGAATCQPSHPSLCLRARVFGSKTSTCAASPASLCFSWPFPTRRSRRGHAPIPSFLHSHKKAQKFPVCFAVEKTAKPATFLFHFIFTRGTEACREGHGNENTLLKSRRGDGGAECGSIVVKATHQIPFY